MVLTAELKDELSAPLEGVRKDLDGTTRTVERANKAQASSTQEAASIMEKALGRATGAHTDMAKAVERATGKHKDAMHAQELATGRVNTAQQRLDELRSRSNVRASTMTAAENRLHDAQFKQAKALDAATEATRNLEEARASLADAPVGPLAPQVDRSAAVGTLAPAVAVAGGAVTAGFGAMLNTYADFDKSMSAVQAATHETTQNMRLLREEAIRVGADTSFSAAEAAQGIEELSKAGVDTQAILGGGLSGALDLAAAGNLGVGEAAEIAATAMTQFKLEGKQIPHLADLLAAGAGKAQGSVTDLGEALKQSGLVASATGLSVEETTGTLAAFASAGLLGSDAGTSLKTMLQRLQAPSKESAGLMEDLGINMYNTSGEFAGMTTLAGQLTKGLGDKTQAERDAAMATIFGSDAVRAANVLYAQGADGIADWTEKVNDAGYAADTAALLQNNLAGDLEKLGGSFDTVFLQSGSGANDVLRLLVQSLEKLVDGIGQLPAPFLAAIGVITGLTGGTLLMLGAVGMMAPKVKEGVGALRDLTGTGTRAGKAVRGIGGAARYAGAALAALAIVGPTVASWVSSGNKADPVQMADSLFQLGAGGKAAKTGLAGIDQMFTGKGNWFDGLDVQGLEGAFKVVGNPSVSDNIDNTLSSILSFGTRGSSNIEFAKKNFAELDLQLAQMATGGASEQAAAAYEQLSAKAREAGVPAEKLAEIFPGYARALGDAAVASETAAGGSEVLNEALEATGVTTSGLVEDMEKFLELLFATGVLEMDARDAAFAYQESLRGVKDVIDQVNKANSDADPDNNLGRMLNKNKTDFELTTQAGSMANAAFQNIARGGMSEVEALAKQGLGQDVLQDKLSRTYDDLILNANQFGIMGTAADDLARKVLGIPEDVKVDSWMSDRAKEMAEQTQTSLNGIDKDVSIDVTARTGAFWSAIGGITGNPILGTVGVAVDAAGAPRNSGGGVYMAGGGVVPGYAPGVDEIPAILSRGESVLVPELTQAIGPGNIMALNHAYSGGRPAGAGPARSALTQVLGMATTRTATRGDMAASTTTLTPAPTRGSRIYTFAPQITVEGGGTSGQAIADDLEPRMRAMFEAFVAELEKDMEGAY
ncbi:phage tail tape measure protein [Paeniglutamicibacter sp. R2-26]|uniref:phage tail tape measure protein n=1 Tax=Paeniglutamicibacter sp. R2-26 TaxID=3144417 RepID=UPI003EE77F57